MTRINSPFSDVLVDTNSSHFSNTFSSSQIPSTLRKLARPPGNSTSFSLRRFGYRPILYAISSKYPLCVTATEIGRVVKMEVKELVRWGSVYMRTQIYICNNGQLLLTFTQRIQGQESPLELITKVRGSLPRYKLGSLHPILNIRVLLVRNRPHSHAGNDAAHC